MSEPKAARAEVAGTLISDYLYREVPQARELVILLHGYQQSGKNMMDKLAACFTKDVAILAPNGPFPLPDRKPDGSYRIGFSWYFYNAPMDEYYIDMTVALQLLEGLVRKLGLAALPMRIVGFSQGGYLAPFAALRLGQVKQVVGIAAEYLPQEIDVELQSRGQAWPPAFRCDAIHGDLDEVVPVADTIKAHQEMAARGTPGKLVRLAHEAHRMTPAVQDALRELLSLAP